MSKNLHKKLKLFSKTLFLLFFFLSFINVEKVNALTVSPPRIDELKAAPGQKTEFEIKLTNQEEEPRTYEALVQNFQSKDETGTPEFLDSKTDLALWLKLPDPVSLEPKETKKLKLSISIPENAEPGGYNAAILFKNIEDKPNTTEGINLSGGTGTLLLLTVTGKLSEQGGILEFNTKKQSKLYTSLPVEFYYRFQNSGQTNTRPQGSISIYNTINRNIQNIPANPEKNNVLKQSIRKFDLIWQNTITKPNEKPTQIEPPKNNNYWTMVKYQWENYAFGLYTAKIGLAYGTNPIQYSFADVKFFILPWQLLSFISLLLIITLLFFTLFLKTYNKWLLSSKTIKPLNNSGLEE